MKDFDIWIENASYAIRIPFYVLGVLVFLIGFFTTEIAGLIFRCFFPKPPGWLGEKGEP